MNPSLNDAVLAMAVDADDNVYAGSYGFPNDPGQVVKLAGNGAGVAEWNVSVDGFVAAIAIDPDGAIYVGGSYSEIAGVPRQNIAKLSVSTALPDPGWDAAVEGGVLSIAIDGSHAVYAGGTFQAIGGRSHAAIARLSPDTGVADADWNPPIAGQTNALALTADGSLYAGGLYSSDDTSTHSIVKLDSAGALDTGWSVHDDGRKTFALAVGADGSIFAAGTSAVDACSSAAFLARLSGGTGAAIIGWNPAPDGTVIAALLADSAGVWAGGDFTAIGGQARGGLAALPIPLLQPEPLNRGHSHHARPAAAAAMTR